MKLTIIMSTYKNICIGRTVVILLCVHIFFKGSIAHMKQTPIFWRERCWWLCKSNKRKLFSVIVVTNLWLASTMLFCYIKICTIRHARNYCTTLDKPVSAWKFFGLFSLLILEKLGESIKETSNAAYFEHVIHAVPNSTLIWRRKGKTYYQKGYWLTNALIVDCGHL